MSIQKNDPSLVSLHTSKNWRCEECGENVDDDRAVVFPGEGGPSKRLCGPCFEAMMCCHCCHGKKKLLNVDFGYTQCVVCLSCLQKIVPSLMRSFDRICEKIRKAQK